MANLDIINNEKPTNKKNSTEDYDGALVSWVIDRVSDWEDYRDTNFRTKWDEYYRLWRGEWSEKDKSRDSERSRLISPALSQAIEATVSELEEATFGGGKWFDVDDNFTDEDRTDIAMFRDQLREDLEKGMVPSAISEVFLNGAIYGTGIGKIIVEEIDNKTVVADQIGETSITTMGVNSVPTISVELIAVHPKEFVIDPSARSIDEALGMAHITTVPRYIVENKQDSGVYFDTPISDYSDSIVGNKTIEDTSLTQDTRDRDKTLLVEYHGLVPRQLLPPDLEEGEEIEQLFDDEDEDVVFDDSDLVESIVTIANGNILLRAIKTPYMMEDRCFIAYQHDTVPNKFWGRGIAEKGYNPQKALDSELRGRIDAMALAIHPMMAMDATRIHRGANMKIAPGRTLFTNGDPKGILMPFNFGQVNNNTFSQSGELERMVQMGTGAMDSATPVGENRRNETSSGMSMIMSGSIKRSKRTLANIERSFMKPLINKSAWRYMQFAPNRYPANDTTFVVHSQLGMVARELEQQQLSNMMQTVPPDSPAYWMLLKGVYENSSISNREEMLPVIDQMMKQALKPEQEKPDPLVELKKQEMQLKQQIDQAKLQLDAKENDTEAQLEVEKLKLEYEKLRLKEQEIVMDAKIELAKMEQDSAVTVAQMHQKQSEGIEKSKPTKTPVININQGGNKKISVVRTDNGLEGVVEETN